MSIDFVILVMDDKGTPDSAHVSRLSAEIHANRLNDYFVKQGSDTRFHVYPDKPSETMDGISVINLTQENT